MTLRVTGRGRHADRRGSWNLVQYVPTVKRMQREGIDVQSDLVARKGSGAAAQGYTTAPSHARQD